MDYQSVSQATKQCGLFSNAEVSYWYKYWNVALAVMLSEQEDAQASKESVSSRNLDKLEKRMNYYLQAGCGNLELLAKLGSMKKRLRLNGLALKQLDKAYDKAQLDLFKYDGYK